MDNSNPQNIRVGNPGLKPSFSHTLRFFYNDYKVEQQRGIFSHASFQATQNSVSNSRVYNESTGGWTTTPKNINGNWNAFAMFGFNTALKNKKFNIGTFTSFNYQNNVGYLTDTQTRVEQKNTTTNLNINVTLENQEWATYLANRNSGNFQIARAGWVGDYQDPNTFLDMFITGAGMNGGKYSNAEYDALINQAARMPAGEERFNVLKQAEDILINQDQAIIPLYVYVSQNLIDLDKWGGWYPNTMDYHPVKDIYLR